MFFLFCFFRVSVRIGENTLGKKADCETLQNGIRRCAPPPKFVAIESTVIHHQYYQDRQSFDIGLLRLSASLSLDDKAYVNTICLPTNEQLQKQEDQERFLVAGWGQTEKRTWPKDLMKGIVPRRSVGFCRSFFPIVRIPEEYLICAGGEKLVDTCLGDSGGPLFWNAKIHKGSRYIQYGITRNGYLACGQELNGRSPPSMYSNIAAHMDWIKSSMY